MFNYLKEILSPYCYSEDKNSENEALKKENKILEEKYGLLWEENESLRKENESLEEEYILLKRKNSLLKKIEIFRGGGSTTTSTNEWQDFIQPLSRIDERSERDERSDLGI